MVDTRDDDQRLAEILKQIANEVMPGIIVMEDDTPSRNADGKLAILDMKVWIGGEDHILYQHYEKDVASKEVLSATSAQAAVCKLSVHTQELVRRMVNTSDKLEWNENVAPVLTDYMGRMLQAGYDQSYRRRVLERALGRYDQMKRDATDGSRPVNRPKHWMDEMRREDKRKKRHNWSTGGGCIAPIMVPATPDSELLKMLREVANREADAGLKFKIVETGGRTLKSQVQVSNPTATPGCTSGDCQACRGGPGAGGNCRRSNVLYRMDCGLCEEEGRCTYVGETSRNLYTRAREHMNKYLSRKTREESFIHTHQNERHTGLPAHFEAKVVGNFKDCLSRQVSEGVHIRRGGPDILNSKSEWHQPALWRVQSELRRE